MKKSPLDILKEQKDSSEVCSSPDEFNQLFHQPELEFELKNALLHDLEKTQISSTDRGYFDQLFEKFWSRRSIRQHEITSLNRWIKIAGVAAILVVGLIGGFLLNNQTKTVDTQYFTSLSPKGSISEVILPDNTHIFLNSDSEVKYTTNARGETREVILSGEAWFNVTKDIHHPFVVHTPAYDVKVTGTSFNVKAYPDDHTITTTLEEGCIHIYQTDKSGSQQETIMNPGEQYTFDKTSNTATITQVNTELFSAWRYNKLIFINMELDELAKLLERRFGVSIAIQDSGIKNYHFDGTLKDETLLDILNIIQQTLPIEYHINDQQVIIKKNK